METTVTLNIAVCEDSSRDAALLNRCVDQSGIPAQSESFKNAEALLAAFHAGRFDLIFLDIYMDGETGVSAAKAIRKADKNVVLAFTTASPDHALDGYRVGAFKYLEKPVAAEGVKETLEYALMKKRNRPVITLHTAGSGQADIPLDDVLYFESKGHVVEAQLTDHVITTSQSVRLDGLEKRLPSPPFLRCHHSFIVNLDYVHEVDKATHAFKMKNGAFVYIRRGNLARCTEALQLRVMEKTGRNGR